MKKKGVFAFVGGTELREEPSLRGATIPKDGRQSCVALQGDRYKKF